MVTNCLFFDSSRMKKFSRGKRRIVKVLFNASAMYDVRCTMYESHQYAPSEKIEAPTHMPYCCETLYGEVRNKNTKTLRFTKKRRISKMVSEIQHKVTL